MSMEVKGHRKRAAAKKTAEPVFISKTEIAHHLGVGDIGTLDLWIAKAEFPPPHSRPGQRYAVWLRNHWQHYVDHGAWPREAWPSWKTWD